MLAFILYIIFLAALIGNLIGYGKTVAKRGVKTGVKVIDDLFK
jgi:hypothetical protein